MNRLLIGMAPAEGWRPLRGLFTCGCLLVLSLCLPAAVRAQDKPANELTPEQQRLKKRAHDLNEEAVKLYQQGRYAESTKRLQEVLQIREGLYPKDTYPQGHPDLARSLNNLGALLKVQEQYAKALPYFEQALAMYERLYPKDKYPQGHPELAHSLNNLGALLQAQGEYAKALPYFEQALAMKERLYPKDKYPPGHPDLAQSLNNLGNLLYDQREYAKARPYYEQALAMWARLYPKDQYPQGHSDLAQSLNHLGMLLQAQGDYAKARPYYEQALAMYERLYPKDKYPQGHSDLAHSLNNLGFLLHVQGEYAKARPYYEQALAMYERLYPKDKYPQGHPDLASSLSNLGALLRAQGEYAKALPYLEQALATYERLYPKDKYPQGHPDLARSLNNLGFLLQDQGEYAKALSHFEQALAMRQRLYPKDKYPLGHPDLAISLNNLGALLRDQGEYAKALPYHEQALAMDERLYPKDKYSQGHPNLAHCLTNLGALLHVQGEYAKALPYYEQALAMWARLYPKDQYPQGHPELAHSLNNLGTLLEDQGQYAKALPYLEQALATYERLYPKDQYSQGHPNLALSLNNLGGLLQAQGEYAKALPYLEKSLAMRERLYPKDRYPQGHPELAQSLNNLGFLIQDQGEYAKALPYLEKGLAMDEELADAFLANASEAEALNRLASLPFTRDAYLSLARRVPQTEEASYAHVWRGKAAVARVLERRQQTLALTADPACADLARDLTKCRQTLARLLLAPAGSQPDLSDHVQKLTNRKEELERQLARKLPAFKELQERDRLAPADLLKRLPARTAFIDFLRYYRIEQDPKVRGRAGEKWTASYLAFVLRPGQPVRRVELGPAAPIEEAANEWRRAVQDDKPSAAAASLRKRVWEPVAEHLPAGVDTVFLAPDGALTALPWVALPGPKPGTVLLEEPFTLALVPHGRFLLDRLLGAPPPDRAAGLLLAVGAVQYDQAPKPVEKPKDPLTLDRGPERGGPSVTYKGLPGTERELHQVLGLAGKRETVVRRGAEASSGQLLLDLPKARWVHLATHGFFADKRFRSALQLDEKDYQGRLDQVRGYQERIGAGARNPLVLSGLVLAGANLPERDDGILTAEALADLRLRNLDLAVLSACETGLGDVAGGEGVFGLQRAFHIAGAKNVVASLWKVEDEATAALMALFYRKLWQEGKPAPLALKEAQLALYRNPESIPALAKARGPDFDKEVRRVEEAPKPSAKERAGVRQWAGFVVSGIGR
jgi:tetratricopeptide (TPR) repeat protein